MAPATSKIIVAVDFGTTFSGVAWAQTARPDISEIITQFPEEDDALDGMTDDRVPTKIAYVGTKTKWGSQIAEGIKCYQEFKLELDPDRKQPESVFSLEYPDLTALTIRDDLPAVDLTVDYLSCLNDHFIKVLVLKLGQVIVDTTPIEYILTVPAMWTDAAKWRTRTCAKKAGMTNIQLISEPEAAVTYVIDSFTGEMLLPGSSFVLCDGGGGTVDVISYIIDESKAVLRIREVVPGSGHKCGSVYLNRIFRRYIEENYSSLKGWDTPATDDAVETFEKTIKRKFSGTETQDFIIKVPGVADNLRKNIKRGRLTLSVKIMKKIFEPVVTTITTLIQAQMGAIDSQTKAVLLVGGFGQSPYLREYVKKIVPKNTMVMQPANGWTAIVRGALLRGLAAHAPETSRLTIASRKARKAYGISRGVAFDGTKHDDTRRYWDSFDGYYRTCTINWLVKKGDELKEDKPIVLRYRKEDLVIDESLSRFRVSILAFESDGGKEPPVYEEDGAKVLATLKADLSKVPTHRLTKKFGNDGELYYTISVEIHCKFSSAHIEYSLWDDGVCYGSVEASYA